MSDSLTLVSAMARLRRGPGRGFTFIGRDRQERYYPYEELEAEAWRRAAHLQALGLKKGDRAALVLAEPEEFVLTFLGCVVAGVVPVPVYPRASFKNAAGYVEILAHIITTSGARVVFCLEGNRELVEQTREHGASPERILDAAKAFSMAPSPDGAVAGPFAPKAPVAPRERRQAMEPSVGPFAPKAQNAVSGETPEFSPPKIAPEDLCFLQFTSGSTSKPKGVMVTHANLVANATAFLGPHGLDRNDDDLGVSWLPLFHDMGLIGFVLGTLVMDIPVVLLPTETFARSPGLWLETISKHRGTITYAPNFAYQLVTRRVKAAQLAALDLSSLRVAGSGAEPIRPATLREFAAHFAPAGFRSSAFLPSYGMAESTLAITFHPVGTELVVDVVDGRAMKQGRAEPAAPGTPGALEVMSCGRPFPGHELAVIDDEGRPLGERVVGQVVSRGPSVTPGYFENAEATAEAIKDGWLQTGDLGYFADGNLFICGRVKDLIIIRGANHYPQDLEWAVSDLEGVRRGNVFAFSVMRDGTEELVIAAEANRGDAERLREEIARKTQQEFGLTPMHVAICPVGTLPKTSSGKAQRRKTKMLFEDGQLEEHG